jgi:carboxyl-terminal processing protease
MSKPRTRVSSASSRRFTARRLEQAGILAGDVVLRVDGEDITGLPEWESHLAASAGLADTTSHADGAPPGRGPKPVDIAVTRGTDR